MARTWLSIQVELVSGGGSTLWPRLLHTSGSGRRTGLMISPVGRTVTRTWAPFLGTVVTPVESEPLNVIELVALTCELEPAALLGHLGGFDAGARPGLSDRSG